MLCLSGFEQYSRWVPLTCHDTKDSAGLFNNSRISFLNIVFYWNYNLTLCFSLADTKVNNR